jgi:hypothetical protein
MKRIAYLLVAAAALACVAAATTPGTPLADEPGAAISEGKLPAGYRDWRLISVAHEEGELNDIRAVLGNDAAIKAYREGREKTVFPDGAVIARLAWRHTPSEENNKIFGRAQSFIAGPPVNGVQFMVKDTKKFASTGGWAFAQFDGAKPVVDTTALHNCFTCHARLKDRDLVFTRYAP